jgi:two-component system NtrC family sensor kinase
MHCPGCQHENRPPARFCEECGTPLTAANPGGTPAPSYAEITSALSEAQEQQTATAGILRVISSSPTDVQPVFAAVLRSAARLCDAFDATIFQVDGDRLRIVAHEGPIPITPAGALPLIRGTAAGRAVLDRRTIHVADLQAEVDDYPEASAFARSLGHRTTLTVPLLRGAEAIGTISIRRTEVRPFTDRQIELLETFADQAVIAIENVRLFNETKEALDQQTATSEILRVISSSPTDVQPVFEAIVRSAVRLGEAVNGGVFRFDGSLIHEAATYRMSSQHLDALRSVWPRPADRGTTTGRAILTRAVVHVDIAEDPEYAQSALVQAGFRMVLSVPMLRDGDPIGAISIARDEGRPFSDTQIVLLQTFADQAVIAIENVRLFTELGARNRELTESAHRGPFVTTSSSTSRMS